jgi:hypothetical protein
VYPPYWLSAYHLSTLGVPALQALTESRYQAEHQQLAAIRSRSLLQRLKGSFNG